MPTLIIEATEPFTIIRFENAKFRNSFGLEQALELEKILRTKPKAILFYSGLANVFCSGGNLKDYAKKTKAQCGATNKKIRSVLSALSQQAIPTIVAVDGDCLGGGLELLSAFDHIIASPKSLFAFWQRRIALTYGWGGGGRLLQRVRAQDLKNKSITACLFDVYEAQRIGIVDQISPSHRLLDEALQWSLHQSALPKESFSLLKNFSTKTEIVDFEKVWGNPTHKKILEDFLARSK